MQLVLLQPTKMQSNYKHSICDRRNDEKTRSMCGFSFIILELLLPTAGIEVSANGNMQMHS